MNGFVYRRRFLKGLLIALRILSSYKLAKLVWMFLSPERRKARMAALHRRNAVLIREKAIEMKGVMIKVGQFLSSRIDFLPDEYIEELSLLQDQVPPHDFSGIRQQIVEAFGLQPEDLFSRFDPEPVAAASLGQVHRAALKDGREVAVKIQYPDISRVIETDISMFGILVRLLRGRYGNINLEVLHEEFSRIIRAELDYLREGKSADRFRANFGDDPRVVIPGVLWEFTRDRVLTLEYVEGLKITDCREARDSGIDCTGAVNLLARAYSQMIFIHGFFHGDPHPGNIFITPGPRLIFVDFGMVQAIPEKTSRELRNFAQAVVDRDAAAIIHAMEQMGFILEGADYGRLIDVTQSLIDRYRDIRPAELKALTIDDISREISEIIHLVEYIQIPNNFILLGRTIGMLNGIAFSLNPEINIIEIGRPFIKEFLKGREGEQTARIMKNIEEMALNLWRLPSRMGDLLTRANRGDLSVKLAKSEMEAITRQFRVMTNVMMLVILTVTVAASSLFFMLLGSRPLAVLAGGVSVVLGLLSVFRLMKK